MLQTAVLLFAVIASVGPIVAETITHPVSNASEDKWRIDEPDVKKAITEYPNIVFKANDTVTVTAGGCVQTGGIGKTWKLYVDPRGPDSGSYYHGLIQLPASVIPGSPVRIGTIVGRVLTIPASSPGGDLKLGYEDDKYSDNGYWKHDNGTGNQCKNVPHAWVVIDIHHNATPVASLPTPVAKFDLVWKSSDDSGFPLNPVWGSQVQDQSNLPDPQSCIGFPQNFSDPRCSTQSPALDVATGWNGLWCSTTGTAISGHVNWFPVTYIGQIAWSDHSSNDDDYNFEFASPYGEADVPSNVAKTSLGVEEGALGLEFDSDETIDHFHTSWWKQFHDAVDSSSVLAQSLVIPVAPANSVVTGLLGLDCEHTCRTEIHPVYDLAMQVFDPSDHTGLGGEVWAMFLRNFGDEGYCSSEDHQLHIPVLSVRIPWKPGATGVTILNKPDNSDNYFRTSNSGITGPNITWAVNEGVLVQFDVPPSQSHAMAHGELHLQWNYATGSGTKQPLSPSLIQKRTGGGDEAHEDEGEARVEKFYDALDQPSQRLARAWQKVPVPDTDVPSAPRHAPTRVAQLPQGELRAVLRDSPVRYPAKVVKDAARAQALCSAYATKPSLPSPPCANTTLKK